MAQRESIKSRRTYPEEEINVDELPRIEEVKEPLQNDEDDIVVVEEPESEKEEPTRYRAPPYWRHRARRPERFHYSLRHAKYRQARNRWERVEDLNFNERLAAIGIRNLYKKDRHDKGTFEISLSTLQRMVMHDLQRKLVDLVAYMVRQQEVSGRIMEHARHLLSQYTTVIRDYDFMVEKLDRTQKAGEEDLFAITTENSLGFQLLKDALLLPSIISSGKQGKRIRDIRSNILPGTSRNEHNIMIDVAQLWERLWMGILGGLALIGPMLLMVLHKDLLTTLVTTSVATLLFAVALALLGTRLRGETVLASVAAYAAVLVVFVGTSS